MYQHMFARSAASAAGDLGGDEPRVPPQGLSMHARAAAAQVCSEGRLGQPGAAAN